MTNVITVNIHIALALSVSQTQQMEKCILGYCPVPQSRLLIRYHTIDQHTVPYDRLQYCTIQKATIVPSRAGLGQKNCPGIFAQTGSSQSVRQHRSLLGDVIGTAQYQYGK